ERPGVFAPGPSAHREHGPWRDLYLDAALRTETEGLLRGPCSGNEGTCPASVPASGRGLVRRASRLGSLGLGRDQFASCNGELCRPPELDGTRTEYRRAHAAGLVRCPPEFSRLRLTEAGAT